MKILTSNTKISSNGISNDNIAIYYNVDSKELSGKDKTYNVGKKTFYNEKGTKANVRKAINAIKKAITNSTTMQDVVVIANKFGLDMQTIYRGYC